MDDISFDDTPLEEKAPPSTAPLTSDAIASAFASASIEEPKAGSAPAADTSVPDPVSPASATTSGIAYITVADASGRVLFRRPATGQEVDEALRAADEAEREGQAAMDRIASERFLNEALEGNKPA